MQSDGTRRARRRGGDDTRSVGEEGAARAGGARRRADARVTTIASSEVTRAVRCWRWINSSVLQLPRRMTQVVAPLFARARSQVHGHAPRPRRSSPRASSRAAAPALVRERPAGCAVARPRGGPPPARASSDDGDPADPSSGYAESERSMGDTEALMNAAIEAEDFENAAVYRDLLNDMRGSASAAVADANERFYEAFRAGDAVKMRTCWGTAATTCSVCIAGVHRRACLTRGDRGTLCFRVCLQAPVWKSTSSRRACTPATTGDSRRASSECARTTSLGRLATCHQRLRKASRASGRSCTITRRKVWRIR